MDGNVPLYQQIVDEIRHEIDSGVYRPGERIPTEQELSARFSVSRLTVRRAMDDLCDGGYLLRRQGSGTFVSTVSKVHRRHLPNGKTLSFTEICAGQGLAAGARLLKKQIVPASSFECDFFGLPKGSMLIYIQRLRTANEQPIYEENCYFPYELCSGLYEMDLTNRSISGAVHEVSGRLPENIEKVSIEAVRATSDQASLLDVTSGSPLLYLNICLSDAVHRPIEIGRQYYVGSRYIFDLF